MGRGEEARAHRGDANPAIVLMEVSRRPAKFDLTHGLVRWGKHVQHLEKHGGRVNVLALRRMAKGVFDTLQGGHYTF